MIDALPQGKLTPDWGMLKIRVTGIFRAIERWASESDEHMRLVIILVWAGFAVGVLIATLIAAWVMLPPEFQLF
jgi:hypothetical protein